MIRIRDISLLPGADLSRLRFSAAKLLKCEASEIIKLNIVRRSVDARKKNDIRIMYTVDVAVRGDEEKRVRRANSPKVTIPAYRPYVLPEAPDMPEQRPVVVGFGPAGMFAGLLLAELGLRPLIVERGCDTEQRRAMVEEFWSTGRLSERSNVQFGAGGAGMFSDGKLNTGISDFRVRFVLEQLVRFGAKEDILIDARPHVGTDVLHRVVSNLRDYILAQGGEFLFETKLTGISYTEAGIAGITLETPEGEKQLPCSQLILAIGHSARDTFRMLLKAGVPMEPKPFSMGVRVEHPQSLINEAQYGKSAAALTTLPAADYHLSVHLPDGSSAYSFCMCPGGYVVAAASEEGGVVTNGMSYSGRNGENANAALLVTLQPQDFPYEGTLGGVRWQEELEHRAFLAGGADYHAPAQLVGDFLTGKPSTEPGTVQPTYRPGVTFCDLHEVLPEKITHTLEQAIPALDKYLRGFALPDAVMTAPETRSSSPVRILRTATCESSIPGFYPCGEGAGYAGGITSAAVDGLRCAEALVQSLAK